MVTYARKCDGCWIDVYAVGNGTVFLDLADLIKKLGVSGFFVVDPAVRHGDFIVGDTDYSARPAVPTIVLKKVLYRDDLIDLLPVGTMKALQASIAPAVVKRLFQFQSKFAFTYDEGAKLADDLLAATIITVQDAASFKASWPTQ